MVDRLSHDVAAKVGVVASSPLIRLLNTFMRLGGGDCSHGTPDQLARVQPTVRPVLRD